MGRITPATYALAIPQRATLEETITLKAGGVPVNLTGYSMVAQVWDSEKRREKRCDLVVSYVNRAQGTIKLSADRGVTRALSKGGFWDLLVIEPGGAADYWLEGPATLNPGLSDDLP